MNKLLAALSLPLLLAACDLGDEPNLPETNSPPTVTLTASPQSGPAPLAITFTATATDPDGDALSYVWSVADAPDSATFSTTFAEVGDYPVMVTVSDGQSSATASVTVTVTEGDPTDPEPPTNPDPPVNPSPPVNPDPPVNPGPPTNPEPEPKLTVSATPGGSAPWGVRYDVTATGFPEGSTLETVCRVQTDPSDNETKITDNQIDKDSFACFYEIGSNEGSYYTDSGFVRVIPKDGGKPLAEVTLEPDINDRTDPLYFSGTWKYTYEQAGAEPETGTFSVVREGPGIGGQSEDGAFQMGLEEFRDEALPYFESAKASGYLNPDPLLDGIQRYTLVDGVGISVVLEKVK